MEAYVALLRGINVSGHHPMKMADLKSALSNLGLKNLATYLQSGNLVFESDIKSSSDLEKMIAIKLLEVFGFDLKVKVIAKKEFQESFSNNPFAKIAGIDLKQLYYIHFMGQPDVESFSAIQNDQKFPEKMSLHDEVIYVHYPNGYGRSKLHGSIFEKKLKLPATARNHNTMKNLCKLLEALE